MKRPIAFGALLVVPCIILPGETSRASLTISPRYTLTLECFQVGHTRVMPNFASVNAWQNAARLRPGWGEVLVIEHDLEGGTTTSRLVEDDGLRDAVAAFSPEGLNESSVVLDGKLVTYTIYFSGGFWREVTIHEPFYIEGIPPAMRQP